MPLCLLLAALVVVLAARLPRMPSAATLQWRAGSRPTPQATTLWLRASRSAPCSEPHAVTVKASVALEQDLRKGWGSSGLPLVFVAG